MEGIKRSVSVEVIENKVHRNLSTLTENLTFMSDEIRRLIVENGKLKKENDVLKKEKEPENDAAPSNGGDNQ